MSGVTVASSAYMGASDAFTWRMERDPALRSTIVVVDPATRMRLLHRIAQAAREERSLPVTGAIAGALNLLPVGYVAAILKRADFVASNVPGVPMPVYVAGSKITGMSTFGPTIGTSLNTTLLSYADTGTYPTKKAHVKAA